MKQQQNQKPEVNKEADVTRSENRQAQNVANDSGEEQRQEGAKEKGNPKHHHGSHQEGQYQPQSDDPTMHPSNLDEEK